MSNTSKEEQLKTALLPLKKAINTMYKKAEMLFSKIPPSLFQIPQSSKTRDLVVLRPGTEAGEWQLWKMPSKKSIENKGSEEELLTPLLLEAHSPPSLASQKTNLLIGVPTRDLIALPLWVASEGDLQELVMLELSSKHLLRRGMAEGVKTIPLETKEGRTLVVVLAPTTTPSAATAPYLKHADRFEAAARLLPYQGVDLLIWRELGEICFGFMKNDQCIWFSGSGETEANPFLLGLIKRMAFHLQAESAIDQMPRSMRLIGTFSSEEFSLLKNGLGIIVDEACETFSELPPPASPTPALDLPPEQARAERLRQEKRDRIKKIAALSLLAYFFLIFLGVGNLIIKEFIFKHLSHQFSAEKAPVDKANFNIAQWQEFRSAIDPTTYTLDLLAAVASKIQGEKIRLISLAAVDGRLQIAGEAADVAQAYRFIELIKKAPELQEYQWTSGQPKLAGKNSVRFELEGSLPHAKTSTE